MVLPLPSTALTWPVSPCTPLSELPAICSGGCINGACTAPETCDCQPGYTGSACDVEIDECASDPCINGGTCSDLVNMFSCDCPSLFTGDTCETGASFIVLSRALA